MSDVEETDENKVLGYININIGSKSVTWDTNEEMSIPEMVFWLEIAKTMVTTRVLEDPNA